MQEVFTHERVLCVRFFSFLGSIIFSWSLTWILILTRLLIITRLLVIFILFLILTFILEFPSQSKFQWAITGQIVNKCHRERILEWSGELSILRLHTLYFITEVLGYLETQSDPVQNSISFGQDVKTDSLRNILTQVIVLYNEMSVVLC